MKKIIKYLLLFIVALTVFLVATLPVSVVLPWLPKSVPLTIDGAQGTIWNGRAAQVRYDRLALGAVSWKIHPVSLLLGRLNADFRLQGEGLQAKGHVTLKPDRSLGLADTLVDAEVAKLPLPPQAALVSPAGKINATIRSLSLIDRKVQGADADILWNDAQIRSPTRMALGQLVLNVTGKNGQLNGVLESHKGPLKVKGTIDLLASGLLKTNIRLAPEPSTPREIRDIVPLLGRPDRSGAVTIRQQLRIPGWPA